MSDPTARPTFTAPEAVAATGKSRRQIGRMLAAGELVGAHKIAGEWQIPLESLLAAGRTVARVQSGPLDALAMPA